MRDKTIKGSARYVKIAYEQHHSPANSPERVSLLPIAPGVDFATAVALRRMATSTRATRLIFWRRKWCCFLFYMLDQRHHMLFATMLEHRHPYRRSQNANPESFGLDGLKTRLCGGAV